MLNSIETTTENSEIIKNTLGDIDFLRINNFFLEVINSEKETIIFTTRRCHVLFYMYMKYVFSEETKVSIESKTIISDKSIHFYRNRITNKDCYIVDDVLIHGRALSNVRERVEKYKPKTLKTIVYGENTSAKYPANYSKIKLYNDEWKKLSNRIVASIILTSTPYTSYIYSYSKTMDHEAYDNLLTCLQNKYNNKKLDLSLNEANTNSDISKAIRCQIESYIFQIQDNNSSFSCIRLYYNNINNKCTIVPYCFLGPVDVDSIKSICQLLFGKYSKINNIKQIHPKYRALVAYKSLQLLFGLPENIFNREEWSINSDQINFSYYNNFEKILIRLIDSGKTFNIPDAIIDYDSDLNVLSEENIYYQVFQKYEFQKNADINNQLCLFLASINQDEERYFNQAQEKLDNNSSSVYFIKQKGFPISLLCKHLMDLYGNDRIFDFYSSIIVSSDTGLIAIYPETDSFICEGYCDDYITTGEQVCRLFQGKYDIFLRDVFKYYLKDKFNIIVRKKAEEKQINTSIIIKEMVKVYLQNVNASEQIISQVLFALEKYLYPEKIEEYVYERQYDFKLNNLIWRGYLEY